MGRFVLQVYRGVAGATSCWAEVVLAEELAGLVDLVEALVEMVEALVEMVEALEGLPDSLVDLVEALVDLEEVLLAIAVLQVLQVPEAVGKDPADSMLVERLALKTACEHLRIDAALMASAILQRREPT